MKFPSFRGSLPLSFQMQALIDKYLLPLMVEAVYIKAMDSMRGYSSNTNSLSFLSLSEIVQEQQKKRYVLYLIMPQHYYIVQW